PRDRQRAADRVREAHRPGDGRRGREPEPVFGERGPRDDRLDARLAGVVRGPGSAHGRDLRLADRGQLRPPSARRSARLARPMNQTLERPDDGRAPGTVPITSRANTAPYGSPVPTERGQWFEADPLWFQRAVF